MEWTGVWQLVVMADKVVTPSEAKLLQVRCQWTASTAVLPDNSGRKCSWLAVVCEGGSVTGPSVVNRILAVACVALSFLD